MIFRIYFYFWDIFGHSRGPIAKGFPELYFILRIPACPRSTLRHARNHLSRPEPSVINKQQMAITVYQHTL